MVIFRWLTFLKSSDDLQLYIFDFEAGDFMAFKIISEDVIQVCIKIILDPVGFRGIQMMMTFQDGIVSHDIRVGLDLFDQSM